MTSFHSSSFRAVLKMMGNNFLQTDGHTVPFVIERLSFYSPCSFAVGKWIYTWRPFSAAPSTITHLQSNLLKESIIYGIIHGILGERNRAQALAAQDKHVNSSHKMILSKGQNVHKADAMTDSLSVMKSLKYYGTLLFTLILQHKTTKLTSHHTCSVRCKMY